LAEKIASVFFHRKNGASLAATQLFGKNITTQAPQPGIRALLALPGL
jgi:hypothetical protein